KIDHGRKRYPDTRRTRDPGPGTGSGYFMITIILAGVVLFTVINFAALHTWIERKQSALMQDRIGANRAWVTLPWKWAAPINWILRPINELGLFHPLADAIKMFTKEDYVPPYGDKFLHTLAP